MARIDDLPPDQRAALQLLLKQGRSYDEIAQLLRIEPRAVRERARSALDALGPEEVEGLELDEQDEIADYLLGQQSASRRAGTRELLERSAPGRAWARVVAGELRSGGLATDDNLPDIPAEAAEEAEAFDALQARTQHREKVQRSSKVGGVILLTAAAIAVFAGLALAIGLFDGDDDGGDEPARTATTQTTGTNASPPVEAQINLLPPEGRQSDAAGAAQVARQGNQRAVALLAQGLQPANENRFYAIWLYTSPTQARRLGFPNPQPSAENQGRIETSFALPGNAREFRELIVTQESSEAPERPGRIVLRGRLNLPR
jgi:hypothetical protein